MNEERYPRQAWEAKPECRRGRGQPRMKWEDTITKSVGGRVVWAHAMVLGTGQDKMESSLENLNTRRVEKDD